MRIDHLAFVFVGGLVVGGFGGAVADNLPAIGPSDWLSFFGSLIGVAVAVSGAIYVEVFKDNRARSKSMERLKYAIANLEVARTFGMALVGSESEDLAKSVMQRAMVAKTAVDVIRIVMEKIDIEDVELLVAMLEISSILGGVRPDLDRMIETSRSTPGNTKLISEHDVLLARFMNVLQPFITVAVQKLSRLK
jgi:hypothetical protein